MSLWTYIFIDENAKYVQMPVYTVTLPVIITSVNRMIVVFLYTIEQVK